MVFGENKDRKRKMGLQGVDIIENVTFTFHISKEVAAMFFSNCLGPKIMKTSIERHNVLASLRQSQSHIIIINNNMFYY